MQEFIHNTPQIIYFETTQEQKDALRMAVLGLPRYGQEQQAIVNTVIEKAKAEGNTLLSVDFLALLLLFPNHAEKLQ